ncbi:DUF3800 domain-containing protein [Bordetella genomosp. 9]|uniref:DUF3800 domain-containing protein n=1 Tax=Bordetella genomosp. 9 TaxID=1416803 RepID=UPI00211AFF07|nr:DUF3800 domain-containing protein [Bordetella genomosp. 9]
MISDGTARTQGGRETKKEAVKFSPFVAYVDESGDHCMPTLDRDYPVFVLALCAVDKSHYAERVVPALHHFKFRHFGHDLTVLHEHDIRKEKGHFRFRDRLHKQQFLEGLTQIVDAAEVVLICCVIDKRRLLLRPERCENPYHIALRLCLEAMYEYVAEKGEEDGITHIVVECRGKKEDYELELEFRRICSGQNCLKICLPFEIIFADKKANSPGLQLADLVARPIGISVLRPHQPNRAFEVIKRKLYRSNLNSGSRGSQDRGLQVWP